MSELFPQFRVDNQGNLEEDLGKTDEQILSELEQEIETAEVALGLEPEEKFDPTIKTLIAGSGTVTRYRIVEGKKQIVDEMRPIPFRKGVRGGKFLEPVVVEGVGTLLLTPDFRKRFLAGEAEATAVAAKFGIEAVVTFFRRFTPDRRKQVDSPDARDVPKGEQASAVSETQAGEANEANRKSLTRMAIKYAGGDHKAAIARQLGVAEAPVAALPPGEVILRQAYEEQLAKGDAGAEQIHARAAQIAAETPELPTDKA